MAEEKQLKDTLNLPSTSLAMPVTLPDLSICLKRYKKNVSLKLPMRFYIEIRKANPLN